MSTQIGPVGADIAAIAAGRNANINNLGQRLFANPGITGDFRGGNDALASQQIAALDAQFGSVFAFGNSLSPQAQAINAQLTGGGNPVAIAAVPNGAGQPVAGNTVQDILRGNPALATAVGASSPFLFEGLPPAVTLAGGVPNGAGGTILPRGNDAKAPNAPSNPLEALGLPVPGPLKDVLGLLKPPGLPSPLDLLGGKAPGAAPANDAQTLAQKQQELEATRQRLASTGSGNKNRKNRLKAQIKQLEGEVVGMQAQQGQQITQKDGTMYGIKDGKLVQLNDTKGTKPQYEVRNGQLVTFGSTNPEAAKASGQQGQQPGAKPPQVQDPLQRAITAAGFGPAGLLAALPMPGATPRPESKKTNQGDEVLERAIAAAGFGPTRPVPTGQPDDPAKREAGRQQESQASSGA